MNGRMKNRPLWIKLSCKYWQEKYAREKTLGVVLEVYEATPVFSDLWILWRMWSSQWHENFQGAQGPVERIQNPCSGGH